MAEVVVLRKEKETKNFVKYSSDNGRVIASIYLPKNLANGKEQFTATIE